MSFTNSIGNLKQALTQVAPAAEAQKPRARGVKSTDSASSAAAQPDATSLSPIGGLIAQALGSSDVRTAKVEELRNAIANGTYKVSASKVADKIVQSMTD